MKLDVRFQRIFIYFEWENTVAVKYSLQDGSGWISAKKFSIFSSLFIFRLIYRYDADQSTGEASYIVLIADEIALGIVSNTKG